MPKKNSSNLQRLAKFTRGRRPQLLRGMKDVLPQDQPYWEFVLDSSAQISRAYGYDRIDLPVLEEIALFVRSVGLGTDIVEKELYEFETKGGERVVLRPEFTAGICRAYIEHGMVNLPQPVKLWTSGPLFRYDRPQAGRYRQLHQCDWEILGSEHPALDGELISFASHLLADLGVNVITNINSIGCKDCRPHYITVLKDHFRSSRKDLCENCQNRFGKNPLRLLDCKEENCRKISSNAPHIVDHLCESCREHFTKVLEYLDEADIEYRLQHTLVRGLDYYSRTTFECVNKVDKDEENPLALVGGGRYDYLINDLSGQETPAVGMAMGIERVILAIKEAGVEVAFPAEPDVFFAHIGETARRHSLALFEDLRKVKIAAASNLSKNGLSDQLSLAHKSKARITLILGQKEMIDNTIILRDMETGSQEIVAQSKLIETLKKRLS